MGRKGQRVWRWGERKIIYLSLHCHHQNDSCITMGSDESHFNVSIGSDGQSHRTVSTNHNLFEEKGEPKPRVLSVKRHRGISIPFNRQRGITLFTTLGSVDKKTDAASETS